MRILHLFIGASLLPVMAAAAPTITGVLNAASDQPVIASGTFVSIFGSSLGGTTDTWSGFAGGALPTSLDGVKVTINGIPAYVAFISTGQINVLAPDDSATGMVPVVVTNAQGNSNAFVVNKQSVAPALFAYSQEGGSYAIVQSALSYETVAPPALLGKTVSTVRAAPYENVILWATGLGPTNPAQPAGQLVSSPVPLAGQLQISIGGQQVTPQYVGLVYSGVYQINLQIPPLPSGDAVIKLSVNGIAGNSPRLPIQAPVTPIAGQTGPQLVNCIAGSVDYVTYQVSDLPFGRASDVSIGGADACASCSVNAVMYPEFVGKLERALKRGQTAKACYDSNGIVYQLTVQRKN